MDSAFHDELKIDKQRMRPTASKMRSLVLWPAAVLFLAIGGREAVQSSRDFIPAYTGARCLVLGCNPYSIPGVEQQYLDAGGPVAELPEWRNKEIPLYPPSTLLVLSPLAVFQFPVARVLWFLLNGCLLVAAVRLVLAMSPQSHPWLLTVLGSIFLLRIGVSLLEFGQPSAFAISLLSIGCYLFLRTRFLRLGTLLLILSLAVKPQIGALIVLYLLTNRIYRRYAAVALVGALGVFLCGSLILRLHPQNAPWSSDWRANLAASEAPGGINDPRPSNEAAISQTNLQAITSIFSADAKVYNSFAYAIFLVLSGALVWAGLRVKEVPGTSFLVVGALSALTLIPVYHRNYDAALLLLALPSIVIVVQRRRFLGAIICAFAVLANTSVQRRLQLFLVNHGEWERVLQNKVLFLLLLRQRNMELLILFCLYLAAIVVVHSPQRVAFGYHSSQREEC